jgi:hypothetical protein
MRSTPRLGMALLLCGVLVAGCGSSGSTTSGSTRTTTPTVASTSTPSTPAPTPTTSVPPSSTSSSVTPGSASAVAEYAAVCKTIVESAPTLSASVKSKVEGICEKAAKGDRAGARAAAKEVCVEVISASPASGAAKEKALEGCKGV